MSANRSFLAVALMACLHLPAFSQVKPAESMSKVKKVFHYTKVGGWVHTDGIREMTEALNILAAAKGFQVTHSADASLLSLAYLKTFNAIIWDNNVDGGNSVPDPVQRKAVLDYVTQGGGWLIVHGAGDHHNSWNELYNVLGTTFTTHGDQGQADINFDAEASAHKELKWLVQGLPAKARLFDEWYSFQNTVRGKAGVTVVATAGNGAANVLKGLADGSMPKDYSYIWAKDYGKGRTLYTGVGHGQNQLYTQADNFATKALWENLRYVAGDYQNGCINKNSANFDATARVDNGSCQTTGVKTAPGLSNDIKVQFSALNGFSASMAFPHSGLFSLELRSASGAIVWKSSTLKNRVVDISEKIRPGIYYMKAVNGKNVASRKVVLL